MIARRRRAIAVGLATLVLAAAGIALVMQERTAAPTANRPTVLLLTSLPLIFSEDFSVQHSGSPFLKALQARYRVVPISVTNAPELAKGGLLLMAQPPAQTAENLVTLDAWVRRGGRLLLFADPMLEWPSRRALGDPLRPPPMFADTGLLAHWGLRLDTPEQRGPAERTLARQNVMTVSPGTLWGGCDIGAQRLAARCTIGKGEAIVVADADLLDVGRIPSGADHNLDAALGELAMLERK